MEITIEGKEENTLLNRKEIQFSIVHDGETPSRLAVRDSIAAKLDKASDEVIVHEMNTRFGMNETLGFAKVYEGAEDAREIEEEYMLERNKVATGADGEATEEETPDEEPEESAAETDESAEEETEEATEEAAEAAEDEQEEDESEADEATDADEDAEDETDGEEAEA